MGVLTEPARFFGFLPGEDRRLASWEEISSYLAYLSGSSPRIKKVDMGLTTEGRPFYYLVISSPEALERMEEYRRIQEELADPRRTSPERARELVDRGRVVVLVTCSIHATEVGAAQMTPALVYEFATGDDPEIREILDNVIFLLVPSLNPDGLDLVVDWYRRTLDTPFEGTAPPMLYHKYAGHDNNRDWFMLNLTETRLVVEKVHNVWRPQIVLDLHQMGSDGFRMFLPPYVDPYDPNVDHVLCQEINSLGTHIMTELVSRGKAGVLCHSGFDAFTPARAYQHYHGGVRILSELASVKIATPVVIPREQLRPAADGQDPRETRWNHPLPWQGGEWHLRDIIDYETIAVKACLLHAARWRKLWLTNFYEQTRRWLERDDPPFAYVFPTDQKDTGALLHLLEVLMRGMVEVEEAVEPFVAQDIAFPTGTFVVYLRQPYGRYAKTLLEVQKYPDLRRYPGGPPIPPYDVTGHTLPLAMGVKCVKVDSPFQAKTVPVSEESLERRFCAPAGKALRVLSPPGGRAGEKSDVEWLGLLPWENSVYRAVNLLLDRGVPVWRCLGPWGSTPGGTPGDQGYPAGTFFAPADEIRRLLEKPHRDDAPGSSFRHAELGLCVALSRAVAAPSPSPEICVRLRTPRVGVYRSDRPVTGEGWLRYVLESYGFRYSAVTNRDVRHGGLRDRFDVILVPSQPAEFIRKGNAGGTMPPEYTGGWEEQGKFAVLEFVETGGTLVMMDRACQWAVEELGVPVRNAVGELSSDQFFCPGSILRIMVDTAHPLAFGMQAESAVMFARSPAWEIVGPVVTGLRPVAWYPQADPLLSGWLLGERFLRGKLALLEYRLGEGRIVLIGFEPHFRAQFTGTYRFLFNAVFSAVTCGRPRDGAVRP